MQTFDGLLRELVEVDEELDQLPGNAFMQRIELHDRQHDLRARLHELAPDYDSNRPRAELESELEGLEAQLDEIRRQHISMAEQDGEALLGKEAGGTDAMNLDRALDESRGVQALSERIAELRRHIHERA
jgi:hypothetical protein